MSSRVPLEDDFDRLVRIAPPRFQLLDGAGQQRGRVLEEPRESSPHPPTFEVAELCENGCLIWVPEVVLGVDTADIEGPEFWATLASRRRRLQIAVHPDKTRDGGRLSR